jgi:TonB family protein
MKTKYSLYNLKIIGIIVLSITVSNNILLAQEGYCAICSREAWAGDSVALNKFMTGCGVIDTVGYDSLNRPANKSNVAYQKITMKLNSGKVMYSDSIYFVTDQMPEFKGGMKGLYEYLTKNIQYPKSEKKITGTVYVKFIVERDGMVKNASLMRGIGEEYDKEALRVVKNMPAWAPGKKKEKPVRVQFNLPVKFSMN